MIVRIMFFALMAMGLLGFGTVAWISTRPPATAAAAVPPPAAKTTVLVAARNVRAGSLLKPEDLTAKEILAQDERRGMSPNTPEARQALVGSMVKRDFAAGDPLREGEVVHPGDHGFLAAVLEPGMRAVTVGVDAVTGTAGLIWPGDRVDLILTQSMQNASLPIGRRVAAETVLSDVRVIAIDQQLVQGSNTTGANSRGQTVTLEVTEEQAEQVSVAIRLGRLSLVVRSAEPGPGGTHPHTPAHNTTWAVDVSPALGQQAPQATQNVVRVYQGSAEAKEFKFE